MKLLRNPIGSTSTLLAAGITCLALASGCCTRRSSQAAYYPARTSYLGGTGQEETYQASGPESEGNIVVPLYEESVNVGKREVDAGAVRLKKVVKTETVNVPVQLRHEEVVIDRDASASSQSTAKQELNQPFQEQETVIRLKREEPVLEKQTAPNGQIVVQTRFTSEQTNIQTQIRREDIDINKMGHPQNVIIGENVHVSNRANARVNRSSENEATGAAESPQGQSTGREQEQKP